MKRLVISFIMFIFLLTTSSCKKNDISPQIIKEYEAIELKTAKAHSSEYEHKKIDDLYSYYDYNGSITIYYDGLEIYKEIDNAYYLYDYFYVKDNVLFFISSMLDENLYNHITICSVSKTGEVKKIVVDDNFTCFGFVSNGPYYYLLLKKKKDNLNYFFKMDMDGNVIFYKELNKQFYGLYLINDEMYSFNYENGENIVYKIDDEADFQEIDSFKGIIQKIYLNDLKILFYKIENNQFEFYIYNQGEVEKIFQIKCFPKEKINDSSASIIYKYEGITYNEGVYYFVYQITTDKTYNFYNKMAIVCYFVESNEYKLYSPEEEISLIMIVNNIIFFGDTNLITLKKELKKIEYD